MISPRVARYCSRPATPNCWRAISRTGSSPIACRCASSCYCTNTCGARNAAADDNAHARKAVVLVSGGLDSATVLALARAEGYACQALSFDYGQRHRAELAAAARIALEHGEVEHKSITLNLDGIGGSALTDERIAVPEQESRRCRRD